MTEHVSMGLAVTYTDTRYTQTIRQGDEVVVGKGDPLGGIAPPWNVSASFDYEFPVTSDVSADIRAEDHFRGGNLASSTNLLNLRGTVHWPGVDLGLFVNNALDSRPSLNAFTWNDAYDRQVAYTFRPRTVGVSATWRL
jgi:outer membrane receptor protein involved in Fe transport